MMAGPPARITIGYSPCPNDTFIFHALVKGLIDTSPLVLEREILADVETLNAWALAGKLAVTKLSFQAFGHVAGAYTLLSAGAALGRGCGPLLVAREQVQPEELASRPVAVPGRLTTAAMLLKLFAPGCRNLTYMPFDRIMPSIMAGVVAAGVIIHESRFTYRQQGLVLVQDLGAWWEELSGHPIPLGGIAAKRSLGPEIIARIDECVRQSVQHAFRHPGASRDYVRQHAQELDERVIREHIGLYVTPFSENLGTEGLAAVRDFLARGAAAGLFPAPAPDVAQAYDSAGGEDGDP